MNPVEKLHYALGEIAYALVWSDERIKKEEVSQFIEAVTLELNADTQEFDLLGTMFKAMTGDKADVETTYEKAMAEIRRNADYLNLNLKRRFIRTLEHVEKVYAPFTVMQGEHSLVDRFKSDVAPLKGRRVYLGTIFLN